MFNQNITNYYPFVIYELSIKIMACNVCSDMKFLKRFLLPDNDPDYFLYLIDWSLGHFLPSLKISSN